MLNCNTRENFSHLSPTERLERQVLRAVARMPKTNESAVSDETVVDASRIEETAPTEKPRQAEPEEHDYYITTDGIWQRKPRSLPIRLTNFNATIVEEITEDDGVEKNLVFRIDTNRGGRYESFEISPQHFGSMRWHTEKLGSNAVIFPHKEGDARIAIQLLSGSPPRSHTYKHIGWTKINRQWVYLHAKGGIGKDGPVVYIGVRLAHNLDRFVLPDPPDGDELVSAIHASLYLLKVAPHSITLPLLAAIYRTPLGHCDFSIHLAGRTGEGKTALAALVQQHFGAEFDARSLPASWESTENFLAEQAFLVKDAIIIIDDFCPQGRTADVQALHKKADRVLRGQGNRSSRGRLKADGSLRPAHPPRGLIISTGEDIPTGHSLRSRMLILEVEPGMVDFDDWLGKAQEKALDGAFARATAGYIRWLAQMDYGDIQDGLSGEIQRLRTDFARDTMHRRTPGIAANLLIGLNYFLDFAVDSRALSGDDARQLYEDGWKAIGMANASQAQYQAASDPVLRFIDLLRSAINSALIHVADRNGGVPENPQAWGWRVEGGGCTPSGKRVGWLDGDDLYLEPNIALSEVQSLASRIGEPLTISGSTLWKRMKERGQLASIDQSRGTNTVRRRIESHNQSVLHVRASLLYEKPDKSDIENVSP